MGEKKEDSEGALISICLLALFGLGFMVMKLTDVIDWGWEWVMLPFGIIWAMLVASLMLLALNCTPRS